jgi:hypothetical protein
LQIFGVGDWLQTFPPSFLCSSQESMPQPCHRTPMPNVTLLP